MKKLLLLLMAFSLTFALAACSSETDEPNDQNGNDITDNGNNDDPINGTPSNDEDEPLECPEVETHDNIIKFPHLDGYGTVVDRNAYILFEYEMRDYVKYQLAYVACTCRAPQVNYWKVAYVELGLEDFEIQKITFSNDGTGNYTAGFWGDSDPIPTTGHTYEDFRSDFIPWLEGQTLEDLEGIEVFTNAVYPGNIQNDKELDVQDMIDAYTGASVTTNNMIRVMKTLLEYHVDKYN